MKVKITVAGRSFSGVIGGPVELTGAEVILPIDDIRELCCRFHADGGRVDWCCGDETWPEWLEAHGFNEAVKP